MDGGLGLGANLVESHVGGEFDEMQSVSGDVEDAVLALQHQVHAVRDVVRHEGGQADAEVDVGAVGQLRGGAGGHLRVGPAHGFTVRFSIRLSAACSGVSATTRCTNTPGV